MSYRSKVAIVYLLGFFVDLINMFIANVAYPAIGQAMGASARRWGHRSANWRGSATAIFSA